MSFKIMYYINLCCPTVEDSLKKIDEYVKHGATRLQIDMPSGDPWGETDFIKQKMKEALEKEADYGYYMGLLRGVRNKYPEIDLSIVVYPDVYNAIGLEKYLEFLKEINATNNIMCGDDEAVKKEMRAKGVTYIEHVSYGDPEYDLERLQEQNLPEEQIVTMRTKRRVEHLNRRYDTWEKRCSLFHSYGIPSKLYAVADIQTKEDMLERKEAGLDGAIVGNVLMRLWNDEEKLWALFNEFQSCAE